KQGSHSHSGRPARTLILKGIGQGALDSRDPDIYRERVKLRQPRANSGMGIANYPPSGLCKSTSQNLAARKKAPLPLTRSTATSRPNGFGRAITGRGTKVYRNGCLFTRSQASSRRRSPFRPHLNTDELLRRRSPLRNSAGPSLGLSQSPTFSQRQRRKR